MSRKLYAILICFFLFVISLGWFMTMFSSNDYLGYVDGPLQVVLIPPLEWRRDTENFAECVVKYA